ncbi:unnamed protein product [Gadus morhua 'NCC']
MYILLRTSSVSPCTHLSGHLSAAVSQRHSSTLSPPSPDIFTSSSTSLIGTNDDREKSAFFSPQRFIVQASKTNGIVSSSSYTQSFRSEETGTIWVGFHHSIAQPQTPLKSIIYDCDENN